MESIGKNAAIALYETKWWTTKSHREIVEKQLFTEELCCPFAIFHEAVEKCLGRPVFTHEFGTHNYKNLIAEFLGKIPAPTNTDILKSFSEGMNGRATGGAA